MYFAAYELALPRCQAWRSAAAMPTRTKFTGRALEVHHLFDKADAYAKTFSNGSNRIGTLFVSVDDTLS